MERVFRRFDQYYKRDKIIPQISEPTTEESNKIVFKVSPELLKNDKKVERKAVTKVMTKL